MAYTQAEKNEILKDRSTIEELLGKYGKQDVLEFIDKINQEMELSKYEEGEAAAPGKPMLSESALGNNFESLMKAFRPFIDGVLATKTYKDDETGEYFEEPAEEPAENWREAVVSVGDNFYGRDKLLELNLKRSECIDQLQFRQIMSSGMGTMYSNRPVGSLVVSICINGSTWINYDMKKPECRKALVKDFNKYFGMPRAALNRQDLYARAQEMKGLCNI